MQISGWLYFFTWSLSFYPQFLLNWRTKSVVGLSLDYVSLNLMGFIGYSIFNVAFFFDSGVQEQYRYLSLGIWTRCLLACLLACMHAFCYWCCTLMQRHGLMPLSVSGDYELDIMTHFTYFAGYSNCVDRIRLITLCICALHKPLATPAATGDCLLCAQFVAFFIANLACCHPCPFHL